MAQVLGLAEELVAVDAHQFASKALHLARDTQSCRGAVAACSASGPRLEFADCSQLMDQDCLVHACAIQRNICRFEHVLFASDNPWHVASSRVQSANATVTEEWEKFLQRVVM